MGSNTTHTRTHTHTHSAKKKKQQKKNNPNKERKKNRLWFWWSRRAEGWQKEKEGGGRRRCCGEVVWFVVLVGFTKQGKPARPFPPRAPNRRELAMSFNAALKIASHHAREQSKTPQKLQWALCLPRKNSSNQKVGCSDSANLWISSGALWCEESCWFGLGHGG